MRRFAASLSAIVLCSLALGAASAFAAAPTIPHTAVSEVTTHSATLQAEINPQGKAVSYHFEYGAADCASNPCASVPSPKEGLIKAGSAAVLVTAPIEGLSPGTSYHFRVVAHNTDGELKSPDRPFATYALPQVFEACPNDEFHSGPGAHLPDCRAYEQASPVAKNGGDLWSEPEQLAVSLAGNAVTFISDAGLSGAEGEQNTPTFLATRGADSWSTQGILPAASAGQDAHVVGWTPDLSQVYATATKQATPQLEALFARSSADGSLATLDPYAPENQHMLAGATTDGSVVLFETAATIGAGKLGEGKRTLFAWDRASGKATQVSVLNTQAQTEAALAKGAFAGPYDWVLGTTPFTLSRGGAFNRYYTQDQNALAADGSAVYFTAAGSGKLYVRLNPTQAQSALDGDGNCTEPSKACTLQANLSKRSVPDPIGAAPAAFQAASADGAKAFFTSSQKLTDDANTGPEQDPPAIERSDLAGTPASIDPTFLPTHALAVAVDSEHVYWIEPNKNTIARAKLNGEDIQDEFISGLHDSKGLAVAGGYVYWTDGGCELEKCIPEGKGVNGTIGKAKLNGDEAASEVDQGFIEGAGNPWAVAANAEHVYWTSSALRNDGKSFIGRANIEGEGVEDEFIEVFAGGQRLPGVALDGSHIYWMDTDSLDHSNISRANLDGSGYYEEDKGINNISFVFLGAANVDTSRHGRGIAIEGNHIYWAAEGTSEIGRAKLNGDEASSEVELDFIEDAAHPRAIAADASHLYWTANVDTPPNPGSDLYRFEAQKPAAQRLVDLTPDPGDVNGAEVRGVLGASADGSYLYFAANGVLAPGATPGNCGGFNPLVETGSCNVYLAHGAQIEFVTQMAAQSGNWRPTDKDGINTFNPREARVSADGQTLIYSEGQQLHRYLATTQSFNCITCDPTGQEQGGGRNLEAPGPTKPGPPAAVLIRFSSAEGKRVFFQTAASLAAEDTNAIGGCPEITANGRIYFTCQDVYEWEAKGEGSCRSESQNGGCIYLISSGKDTAPSFLAGASASGDDVFIFTRSQLVGQDQDNLRDVYDVRVGGGLSSQSKPPPNPCAGEACMEGVSPAPEGSSAGSEQLVGPGNSSPSRPSCRKPRVKKRGKCVKASKHHKHQRKTKTSGRAGR